MLFIFCFGSRFGSRIIFSAPIPDFFGAAPAPVFFFFKRLRLQEAKNMRLLPGPAPQPCILYFFLMHQHSAINQLKIIKYIYRFLPTRRSRLIYIWINLWFYKKNLGWCYREPKPRPDGNRPRRSHEEQGTRLDLHPPSAQTSGVKGLWSPGPLRRFLVFNRVTITSQTSTDTAAQSHRAKNYLV